MQQSVARLQKILSKPNKSALLEELEAEIDTLIVVKKQLCALRQTQSQGETKSDPQDEKRSNYLATKLIVRYPPAKPNVDRTPYAMIAFWRDIFDLIDTTYTDRIYLRRLCHMFNDSLKASLEGTKGRYTVYPNSNHTSLKSLMDRMNSLHAVVPHLAPTIY